MASFAGRSSRHAPQPRLKSGDREGGGTGDKGLPERGFGKLEEEHQVLSLQETSPGRPGW